MPIHVKNEHSQYNQASWPSGIRLSLGQSWGRLGVPKIDSRHCQNNAWPSATTHRERELVEVRES